MGSKRGDTGSHDHARSAGDLRRPAGSSDQVSRSARPRRTPPTSHKSNSHEHRRGGATQPGVGSAPQLDASRAATPTLALIRAAIDTAERYLAAVRATRQRITAERLSVRAGRLAGLAEWVAVRRVRQLTLLAAGDPVDHVAVRNTAQRLTTLTTALRRLVRQACTDLVAIRHSSLALHEYN